MASTPTLIVGAGPAGLVLALSLLKSGVSVRVVDKCHGYTVGHRAFTLQPRTLELYKALGIVSDILAMAGEIYPTELHTSPQGSEPIAVLSLAENLKNTPDYPLINPMSLGQDRHKAILLARLAKDYNVHVEFDTELKSFAQTGDYVECRLVKQVDGKEVEEVVRTEFLVGTDGARSLVRKQLGLTFLGQSYEQLASVVGDVIIKSGIPDRLRWRIWGEQTKAYVSLIPWENSDDSYTFLARGSDIEAQKMLDDESEVYQYISSTVGRDLEFGGVLCRGLWKANVRMVNKFGEGRVLVGGDAAHIHSPAGAQGLNSSVQDVFNLAWKIALVHKRTAPLSLLTSYNDERHPVISTMLKKTTDIMFNTHRAPEVTQVVNKAAFTRGFEMRQLGINYRGSPIVVDEKYTDKVAMLDPYGGGLDGLVKGGDRAPAAPGLCRLADNSTMDLFDLYNPSKHTILLFIDEDGACEEISGVVKAVFPPGTTQTAVIYPQSFARPMVEASMRPAHLLIDKEGYAFKHYNVDPRDQHRVFVVRPDGYIGAIVEGAVGLKRYGSLVFGA